MNYYQELELGRGNRVIIISCVLGCGILVFNPSGKMVVGTKTAEVEWVQLFDVDQDGVHEIVLEAKDGVGTGLLRKAVHVYRLLNDDLVELWKADTRNRVVTGEGPGDDMYGYIRLERADGTTRLQYLRVDHNGTVSEADFVYRKGAFLSVGSRRGLLRSGQ
jgi:hypothetical protein